MLSSTRLLVLLLIVAGLSPAFAAEVTLSDLLRESTSIAIVDIENPTDPGLDDTAWKSQLAKQHAQAKLVQLVRGTLPQTFQIENQNNSILTPGRHLAFLRRLEEGRYILSTPGSLRRIKDGQVYWFSRDFVPLDQALAEIK